jgi:hypothetical protein
MRVAATAMRSAFGIFALALVLLGFAGQALAKPTQAQLDAIKANCRSDFMAHCWGTPRGGAAAFQCLEKNLPSLSAGCQQVIKSVAASAAPAAAPKAAAKKPETKPAPASTSAKASASATPAAPASPPKSEAKTTSSPASSAPAETAKTPQSTATTAPTAAPKSHATTKSASTGASANWQASVKQSPAPAPLPHIGFIPPAKKLMVRHFCREEIDDYCSGLSVGEGRILDCLVANQAKLTSDCRGALAKLAR